MAPANGGSTSFYFVWFQRVGEEGTSLWKFKVNAVMVELESLSYMEAASDQPFFHSAQEGVHFNLYLSGDVGIIVVLERDLPCGDLSRVFGLKTAHRITNPLARAMKLSGSRDATGWCVAV
jgi:hypothetical protein